MLALSNRISFFWLFCIASLQASCAKPSEFATPSGGAQPPTNGNSIKSPLSDSTAPHTQITFWLDSTRMDGASIYQKLFPNKAIQIDFQIVDRPQFPAEILRFNQIVRADKLLMLIAPKWMALASFVGKSGSQCYDTLKHQLGVAVPLRWDGDTQRTNSVMGGGTWVVSSHTSNLCLALDFINWMFSALEFWIITSDCPIYLPVQPAWEKPFVRTCFSQMIHS